MIFKVFFELVESNGMLHSECRVFAVENGERLEQRINSTISNLKADGYKTVMLKDCFNLSEPDRNPWENR